jgi:hypothetical protein
MKPTLLLLFLLPFAASAQIKATRLSPADVPKSLTAGAHIIAALRFTDRAGEHLVVETATSPAVSRSDDEDARSITLNAMDYLVQGGKQTLAWKINDFVKDCSLDITADFIKDAFAVTDLNDDGQAEIWVMYKLACSGDVSPAVMKLIMYEGNKKYALRGETRVRVSDKEYQGGSCQFDEAFKSGPEPFRTYATKLWTRNIKLN